MTSIRLSRSANIGAEGGSAGAVDGNAGASTSALRAFWVASGAVDFFLTRIAAAGDAQALWPIARFASGSLFLTGPWPEALSAFEGRLVALPDSAVHELSLEAPLPAGLALDEAIADWSSALADGAGIGLVPADYFPLDTLGMMPGKEFDLVAGQSASPARGVAWLRVLRGELWLNGTEGVAIAPGRLACISSSTWVHAAQDARVVCADGPGLDRIGSEAAEAMLWAQWALVAAGAMRIEQEELAIAGRIRLRRGSTQGDVATAVNRLRAIGSARTDSWDGGTSRDPVLAACRLAGRSLGVSFPDPGAESATLEPVDRLNAACAAARVQKRRVVLRGEWWREDSGPLVGFLEDGQHAIALLPTGRHGYVAVNPLDSSRIPVDWALATQLAPFGFGLFRSLPATRLEAADLLRVAFGGRTRELVLLGVTSLAVGLIGMAVPIATGYVFDRVIPDADRGELLMVLAGLLGAALGTLAFSTLRSEALLRLESSAEAALQAAVWDRVLRLPANFFRLYSSGDLAARVNAFNEMHQLVSGTVLASLMSGLFSSLNLFLLFYYSASLATICVGLVLLAVTVNLLAAVYALRIDRQASELGGKLSGQTLEYLTGISKLRVAAAEGRAFSRWTQRYAAVKALHVRNESIANTVGIFLQTFSTLTNAVLFFAMVTVAGRGPGAFSLSTGEFVTFMAAFGGFFGGLMQVSGTAMGMLHVIPLWQRARPILEAQPEVDARRHPVGRLRGEVQFTRVVFRYLVDGPAILDGVDLTIRSGEFVAVVGPSGSGKSTLMRLLLGFEEPESGAVYFDRRDLADVDLTSVRKQMGVVLQSSQLMTGDIFSNIIGNHPLTLDDAWDAARRCGLEQDILAMPMGMHTLISEGASTLSGGQRQRILIARAIVRKPRILLFDEATSALDNQTQLVVSRSIETLKATRVVIAHRLSTIVNADRIVVLDRGRVVQIGSYQQLMAEEGLFRELAARQLA